MDSDFLRVPNVTFGADRFGIRSEELFQRLWIPARDLTNSIGSLAVFLTIPEVLPKMGQMIEGVGIDSLLYCIRPLLVCDWHIANRPPDSFTKGFDNLPHCRSFAHQRVYLFGGRVGGSQKSCGNAGYVFGAGERNDSVAIAPGQE